MAEATLTPPTVHWQQLAQSEQLSSDVIREFWRRTVPALPAETTDPDAYDEELCQRLFLEPISQLLVGDAPAQDEASPAGGMCGKVFKKGDPTYSCRDCEQDPTCVLCVDCFKQSAHRQHRYQMCVSKGMGGYCDCGDTEAWKQDPCCAAHQPAVEPAASAPAAAPAPVPDPDPALTARAQLVFNAAIQYVLSVVSPDGSLNIVPLELDLGREHYPPRHQRYCTVIYNYGLNVYDKVADTLVSAIRCLPEAAKAAAAGVRKEGWAVLHVGDYNSCDEKLKGLVADQHRALRRCRVRVVHAHMAAHQRLAARLLRHLRQLLERAPLLRPAFFAVMTQAVQGEERVTTLERLMAIDPRLWRQLRHECHLLLIQGMLMDIESKKYFAEVFTQRYHEQLLASLPSAMQEQSTIQDLSVQIYTVPSIAHYLIAEHLALAAVLGTLVRECAPFTHGGQLVLRDVTSDTDSRARFERLLSCLTDAHYLLTVVPEGPMSEPLQGGVRCGLEALLDMLHCCEGMEPVVRAQTAHVLYDTPYELQVTLAVTLAPVLAQMLEWCASDRDLLIFAYKAVLSKLHLRLPPAKYFREEEVILLGRPVRVSQYPVTEIPVSLELPLSRLFAGLHLHLAAHGLHFGSEELTSEETVTPAGLLERPLRALVMDAQVRAGLWKRNGHSLEIMCSWYSLSMQVAEMRDRDLQVAQICASLMEPDRFVATLLYRHGAQLYFTPAAEHAAEEGQESDLREHIENNMSDLLLLLIHVFSERHRPSVGQVTKEQCLENEVIQFLCVKPMAHSQIAKRLPEADASLLEAVLRRVADFAAHEDSRGLRTYQLKPEFYPRYNCMWGHFSRRDRSMSEQLQLRRRQETGGGGQCLPPPPPPPFQPQLAPARLIITCQTALRVIRAVLQRLSEGDHAGLSEQILQRCLFLIGMALNEEERDPADFCFSRPAQQSGISEVLHGMVSGSRPGSHADLLSWVVTKLDRLLGGAASPADAAGTSAAADADAEQRRRRAAAAARRARILGQMQAQQKRFVTQNQTALEAEAAAAGSLQRAGSSMDVSEGGDEEAGPPVCLGPRQSARPPPSAERTCILCQLSEEVTASRPAWVTAAFVQGSTVLARDRTEPQPVPAAGEPPYVPAELSGLPHTGSCGHAMHAACWRQHFESVAWNRRVHPRVHHLAGYDVQKQEFLCPLCQRLSNTVVPILPAVVPVPEASPRPPQDNLDLWLSALSRAASLADSELEARESGAAKEEESALLQRVAGEMSHRDASQIRRLLTMGDPPPDTHKSTRDVACKYLNVIFTTAHGTAKSSPSLLRQAALRCCVHSLHAAEQLLRHQSRPLLDAAGSRAHMCLTQQAQVCGALLPALPGGAEVARASAAALLRLLLTGQQPAGGPLLLRADALGLMVSLSCGLPALFAPEHGSVSAPSGSLQDLHCVRLALVVRLVQILLTADVTSIGGELPMETDDGPSDAGEERQWLAELYTLVRSAAGRQVENVSPDALRQHVIGEVTPFLRSCALYFHLVTGVRAPAALQQPLSLQLQYPHLLSYLGLGSICVLQATESHSQLQESLLMWCTAPQLAAALALPSAPALVSSRQARLIDLPTEYEDLLIKASTFRCDCGEVEAAASPALCLVCGAMLCSELACARDTQPARSARRGMDAHVLRCGAGTGLLLLVRKCKLYLVHSAEPAARKSTYPPPYVDRFGEVDQGLRRGNPLSLQPELYAKLTRLWLSHGVSDEVTRYMEEFSSGMLFEQ